MKHVGPLRGCGPSGDRVVFPPRGRPVAPRPKSVSLNDLNPPQREAVRHIDGPLLVLAGAGSGKTRVITRKMAHLIADRGVEPRHIAAITFTNKAAQEMRARVAPLLKGRREQPWVSTFHTLGLRILKEEHAALGYRPRFTLFDAGDSAAVIADIARRELGSNRFEVSTLANRISGWKNAMIEPAQALAAAGGDPVDRAASVCYVQYAAALKAYNAFDFDDLVVLPVHLLRTDADALLRWQARLRWLLVDEYQDTNQAQYDLVRLLARDHGRLTAVGDDDQSIYAWRGARPENLAALARDLPNLRVIKLEQNYRSVGVILKAANQLIAHNPHVFEKRLWSDRGHGDRIRIVAAADEIMEAEIITNGLAHHRLLKGTHFKDYAILFRSNHQARAFEHALRERNIPYVLSGGRSFFDAAEIKDAVCYLRLLSNPADDNALLRVINSPRRGIGTSTLETLVRAATARGVPLLEAHATEAFRAEATPRAARQVEHFAEWVQGLHRTIEHESPTRLLRQVLADVSYDDWLEQTSETPAAATRRQGNLEELAQWIDRIVKREESATLADVIAALTLFDILERQEAEDERDCVALMTLHAAKGLEFPHVYLVGFEENILPHRASIEADTIEEERRLAYVGITRARQTLCLSYARGRRRYGKREDCLPSRFLAELPQDELHFEGSSPASETTRDAGRATLSNLRERLVGDVVKK